MQLEPKADRFSVLSQEQVALVKKSLPLFERNSYKIAVELYSEVFKVDTNLRNLFSLEFLTPKSVPIGTCPFGAETSLAEPLSPQARILSQTIVQLASNLEKLSLFEATIDRICNKHVSRNIRSEHYPIVTKSLATALKTVLGDELSAEEHAAWSAAVEQLASIFTKREDEIRERAKSKRGGWEGFRTFVVSKHEQTQNITKLLVEPVDGGEISLPERGQFVCMRMKLDGFGIVHQNITVGQALRTTSDNVLVSKGQCEKPLVTQKSNYERSIESLVAYETTMTCKGSRDYNGKSCPTSMYETIQVVSGALKEGVVVDLSVPVGGGSHIDMNESKDLHRSSRAGENSLLRTAVTQKFKAVNEIESIPTKFTGLGSLVPGKSTPKSNLSPLTQGKAKRNID